ncbi:unnamed protein product [Blepharisma stoltei]|uniref:5'-deoxynucleotidase n=1 Tax=Blepharisma stoltei TaxID=1481888 RepID=A0AAU9JL74_9CILI|nr:unnamed protein product [Blepharisma stoltei]
MDRMQYLQLISKLKHLPRRGWVLSEIQSPETVAGHMYRMAMCAFLLPSTYNTSKIIKMSLVHDVCESIVGDITPHDNVPQQEKFQLEYNAMIRISALLPHSWSKEEMLSLWLEYEEGSTEEARIVKDLDKYDMIVQGFEYEKDHSKNLQSFFQGLGIFQTEIVRGWAEELYRERQAYHNNTLV